jgi:hypothetical protein
MPRARLVRLALLVATLAAPGGPGQAAPPRHPATGPDQDCAGCHEQATPAAWKAWNDGAHGLALVKCQVCHGSTGKDFTLRPSVERCRGCHAAEVASGAPLAKKGVGCFTCHAPHGLAARPHAPHAK